MLDNGENPNGDTSNSENSTQGDSSTSNEGNQTQPSMNADLVNKIVTNHTKRLKNEFENLISGMDSKLSALLETKNPSSEENPSPTPEPQNKEFIKLQKELDKAVQALQKVTEEKQQAQQKVVKEHLKSAVVSNLNSFKVEKSDQVYRLIEDKLIYDEDAGTVKLKVFDPTYGLEDEVDLKSGLSIWLNNEGQHFLPARDLKGSGATSGTQSNGKISTLTLEQYKKMPAAEQAKVNLKEAFGIDTKAYFFGQ